jgi:hypothetical protein
VLLALVASRLQKSLSDRLIVSFAIGISLIGSWYPTASYFGNYHTYPWAVVIGLSFLSVIGGIFCGLRTLPAALTVFLGVWFYAALLPPKPRLPSTIQRDGIECKLMSPTSFQLRDMTGGELSRLVDLETIRLEGNVGPIISIEGMHCWPAASPSAAGLDEIPKGAAVRFDIRTLVPNWTKSFDLRIIVQRWPAKPMLAFSIPLARLPKLPMEVRSGLYRLQVSNVGWGKTTNTLPVARCLRATITYSGFSYSGTKKCEYRVVDDLGNVVSTMSSGCFGSEGSTTIPLEILALNPKASSLRFELISEAESQKLQTVFSFDGLPASNGEKGDSPVAHF